MMIIKDWSVITVTRLLEVYLKEGGSSVRNDLLIRSQQPVQTNRIWSDWYDAMSICNPVHSSQEMAVLQLF